MDQLKELLSNLTVTQIAVIGVALFLLWPNISKFFQKKEDSKKPTVENNDEVDTDTVVVDENEDYDLTSIVYKWETFTDACHEYGLHDACKKSKEIFPLLVKPYVKDHKE